MILGRFVVDCVAKVIQYTQLPIGLFSDFLNALDIKQVTNVNQLRPDLYLNDMYSFLIGLVICLSAIKLAFSLKLNLDYISGKLNRSHSGQFRILTWAIRRSGIKFGKYLYRGVKTFYILFWLGLVIPFLVGLIYEVFTSTDARILIEPSIVYVHGFLISIGIIRLFNFLPANRLQRTLNRLDIARMGTSDVTFITVFCIIPALICCFAILFGPLFISAYLSDYIFSFAELSLSRISYYILNPSIAIISCHFVYQWWVSWVDRVRDDTYLVGRVLDNVEEEQVEQEPIVVGS